MGLSGVGNGGTHTQPILFCSWEPQRGKKQSRGPTSDDDGSFEVVPIEDPGESSAPSGIQRDWKLQCGELNSGFAPSFSSETSDSGP